MPAGKGRKGETSGRSAGVPRKASGGRRGNVSRKPASGAGRSYRAGQSDDDAQDRQIAARSLGFAALAVLLSAGAVTFVISALRNRDYERRIPISAPVPAKRYSVKVLEEDAAQRQALQELARMAELRALAGEHELFVCDLPGGGVALCVGRFPSRDAAEARALLRRFKDYTLKGRRVFQSAGMLALEP